MEFILPQRDMSEEDVKRLYITPALEAKWDRAKIAMERKFTDGRIELKGSVATRGKPRAADYILYRDRGAPIAVVEAKSFKRGVSFGLQQAIEYARILDLPFAYSSNGTGFAERDFLTGKERYFALDEFPTEDELVARLKRESNGGAGLSPDEEKIFAQPFYAGQNAKAPRYYQRIAVDRTVAAVARGRKRLLLAMATGTGKTFTAFQIVWRLLESGLKRKVLYLADRNILVDQSIQQDFAPLEKRIHKINFSEDVKDKSGVAAYEVYFALYQQLVGSGNSGDGENDFESAAESAAENALEKGASSECERLRELFRPDFFDLIIVDECHRGSAKEDSRWRRILEYFSDATQIGTTATPKETKYVSNISYFGEPIYSYSLNDGIEDGFLAPFKVYRMTTNIGDEWRPLKGQRDINGEEIEDRVYNNSDYDYNIVIKDRAREIAAEITRYLKSSDRMAKTIVFCANEDAAERMRAALVEENADMVRRNPDYVVRITGSDDYGKSKLAYFISVSEPFPTIATTSKLLSTGVDCKTTKLIVLDQKIGSMTEFKQIVGRGTRIREDVGKMSFAIMDFRDVARIFADPDWDGPVEIDENFRPGGSGPGPEPGDGDSNGETTPPGPKRKPIVDRDGCRVEIIMKTVYIYDTDGKPLRVESVADYAKRTICGEYATLDEFIRRWNAEEKKAEISKLFKEKFEIDLESLKAEEKMEDVDDFDFLCRLAFDKKPATRRERAAAVKKRGFLDRYNESARAVLDALLEKYAALGVYEIEKLDILELDPFRRMGRPRNVVGFFGGKEEYLQAVRELKRELYADYSA